MEIILLYRKHSDTLTLLGACRHALAAVASPSRDTDVLMVREITEFQSKSESWYPNAPHPPTGDWWRERRASYKKRGFPMKNTKRYNDGG